MKRVVRSPVFVIIKTLQRGSMGYVSIERIKKKALELGYNNKSFDKEVTRLKRAGDVYQPKRGFLSAI